ncbi:MAG: APC family permease, partial [Acidimicrobiia bacterium]
LVKTLTTTDIFMAGVGLVVAASTLVSDFNGWFAGGRGFAIALIAMFVANMFLGLSTSELATTYPKAGALYDYGAAATPGGKGAKTIVGVFLGFLFYVMFAFAGGGETTAGAAGAQGLFDGAGSLSLWIIVLTILAVVPNLLGISVLARLEFWLVLAMLGIRYFFGLAGFAGFGDGGAWSLSNIPVGEVTLTAVIALGGGFAFWSFVGIEFVAPLAEETRDPARSIPRGIIWGLVAILVTALFMGFGSLGSLDPAVGAEADPNAPQLTIGTAMFGDTGRVLMAIGTVLATFSSMTVVYASMPRILYGISRNGHFFGPLSKLFGSVHPRFRTPWTATIVTAVLYVTVAISYGAVVEQIFTAAYVWILLYAIYHVLVVASRYVNPDVERPFKLPLIVPILGFALTIYLWWAAFKDPIDESGLTGHGFFGPRGLWVIGGSLVAAVISYALRGSSGVADHLEAEVQQDI